MQLSGWRRWAWRGAWLSLVTWILAVAGAPVRAAGADPAPLAPAGYSVVVQAAPSAMAAATAGAAAPATQSMRVTILLKPGPGFHAYAQAVSTPGSPDYRQFLTPQQVAQEFGPPPPVVMGVEQYLAGRGFTAVGTADNGFAVQATAPVATVDATFGTQIRNYVAPDGTPFFAPDGPVSFDAAFAPYVTAIRGLSDRPTVAPAGSASPRPAQVVTMQAPLQAARLQTAGASGSSGYAVEVLNATDPSAPYQYLYPTSPASNPQGDAVTIQVVYNGQPVANQKVGVSEAYPAGYQGPNTLPSASISVGGGYIPADILTASPSPVAFATTNAQGRAILEVADSVSESVEILLYLSADGSVVGFPITFGQPVAAQPDAHLPATVPTGQEVLDTLPSLPASLAATVSVPQGGLPTGVPPLWIETTGITLTVPSYFLNNADAPRLATVLGAPYSGPMWVALQPVNGPTGFVYLAQVSVTVTGPTVNLDPLDPATGNALYDATGVVSQATQAGPPATVAIIAGASYTQGSTLSGQSLSSDIQAYATQYGLPMPLIEEHDEPSSAGLVPSGYVPNWTEELELDIERVMATDPGARIVVIAENPNGTFLSAWEAAAEVAPDVLSNSWGFATPPSAAVVAAYQQVADQLAIEGVTVVASSGDMGAFAFPSSPTQPQVTLPAALPTVTAVGGTESAVYGAGATATLSSEWGWSPDGDMVTAPAPMEAASGGGFGLFPVPAYQQGLVPNAVYRGVPDLALDATTPFWATVVDGSTGSSGGTSAAAPTWAGYVGDLFTLLGGQRLGSLNPVLYALAKADPGDFFQASAGWNGAYAVTPGEWNPVTGLGAVDVGKLYAALSAGPYALTPVVPSIAQVTPQPVPPGGTLTIAGSAFGPPTGWVQFAQLPAGATTAAVYAVYGADPAVDWTASQIVLGLPGALQEGTATVAVCNAGASGAVCSPSVPLTIGYPKTGGGGGGGGGGAPIVGGGGGGGGGSSAPAPPPSGTGTVTATISGQRGGTVSASLSNGGTLQVSVPAGAVSGLVLLTVSTTVALPQSVSAAPPGALLFAITATDPQTGDPVGPLAAPATVTVTDAALPSPPAVVFWNPLTDAWQLLPTWTLNGTTLAFTTPHFTLFAVVPAADVVGVPRIAGNDRIGTAILAAEAAFPDGASAVVLANAGQGGPSPDALSAAGLAGALHAPILLTEAGSLSPAVLAAIRALHASTVYVIGGPAAISDAVVFALQQEGLTVVRQFEGADRFQTAALVDQYLAQHGLTDATTLFVANGVTMVDALAASPVLDMQAAPLALVTGATAAVPPAVRSLIQAAHIRQIVVLGGPDAVSSALQAALQALPGVTVTRIAGATRDGTAAAIAAAYFPKAQGFVVAADGRGGGTFVDALSAGPFAGEYQLPILLTGPQALPAATASYLAQHGPWHAGWVMGGLDAVASGVAGELQQTAGIP
ncbi:MAG: cell wall-binding repeat-containing protein [Firmicutes bacterium]|nr:cell wall-binding repeat-containing protein [Alicyclobacillaceae bacterium]MCL6497766.1 cell wall-binding repeat-containing protein [Bacillota bacterium]